MRALTASWNKLLALGVSACALVACPGESEPDAGLPPVTDAGPDLAAHDPLARPKSPTLNLDHFTEAVECGRCHQSIYDEWRTSMHAYAMVDPVFQRIVAVRQADLDGAQDQFCTSCHSSIGTRAHDVTPGFAFADLAPVTMDGVTCEACHKAESVERTYNSGLLVDALAPMYGPITDPVASTFHDSAPTDLLGEPRLCGACHDVVETSGLNLERPFAEFSESPAAAAGKTCQECHMPEREGRAADGVDAPETPSRTLSSHRFVGVDVPLLEGFAEGEVRDALRADVADLLDGAGSLRLSAEPTRPGARVPLYVTVKNELDAHNLPTGTTFIRQLWVEVIVTDADGDRVYESGTLDDNGDLRDAFSELAPYGDGDLIRLGSTLVGPGGAPEIFSWRATEHISTTLSPLYERTFTLFVATDADTAFPLDVEARLLFRSHGPYLLRALGLGALTERIETFTIDGASLSVDEATR